MSEFPKHMTFNAACGDYMVELRDKIKQLEIIYENSLLSLIQANEVIEQLEAEKKRTTEMHLAILDLEGSEGMTDAKFAKWVIAALTSPEETSNY